jgi:hypothetical protein
MMIVDDMAAGGDAAAALKSQPSVGVPADVVEGLQVRLVTINTMM